MKRLVTIVAIAILLIGVVLLGLSDTVPVYGFRYPSEKDVEEAVLRDIAGEYGGSVYHSQGVTEVEVIEYGEPYIPGTAGSLIMSTISNVIWPVKVYFIVGQQRIQRRVRVYYLDSLGEWVVYGERR